MLSMTGFGTGEASSEVGRITVQVATVNNKGCRVSVRSDVRDLALEEGVRKRAQMALERGSVTVQIGFESAQSTRIDREALAATWRELAEIANSLGAPAPTLEGVGRFQQPSAGPAIEALNELVDAALDQALEACRAMRQREGDALARIFTEQHAALVALREQLAARAAVRVPAYRDRLLQRIDALLEQAPPVEPEVLAREVAVYADRIDVTEEMDRLVSHLDQLAALIAAEGAVGKRIEFLLQEIGREVNTTGSKANDAELQAMVVEAKHHLDQLREQAANVL